MSERKLIVDINPELTVTVTVAADGDVQAKWQPPRKKLRVVLSEVDAAVARAEDRLKLVRAAQTALQLTALSGSGALEGDTK